MENKYQNKKRFINLVKATEKDNKKFVTSFNVDNDLLSGFKTPKLTLSIVQPISRDNNDKYQVAKFYLDIKDAICISKALEKFIPTAENPKKNLLKFLQGGNNKKLGCVESRIMNLSTSFYNGKPYYMFSVESCKGVIQPNGTVSPASGKDAQVFAKCSFSAKRDEAVYIAAMLENEILAWRTAVNNDMYYHPENFRYKGNNESAAPNYAPHSQDIGYSSGEDVEFPPTTEG